MSGRRSSGGGMILGGVLLLGLLGLAMSGPGAANTNPNNLPECDKPAPNSCYSPPTTRVPESTVLAPPSSTAAVVPDTGAGAAGTAAPTTAGRPSSEAAGVTAPPDTAPPETQPPVPVEVVTEAPNTTDAPASPETAPRPSHGECAQSVTVAAGEGWRAVAKRSGVSADALASANNTTQDGPLWVGDVLCLPATGTTTSTQPSSTTTTTTSPATPTTTPATAPTTKPKPPATTQPRRPQRTTTTTAPPAGTAPKGGQAVPKSGQGTPNLPTTTRPPCATC